MTTTATRRRVPVESTRPEPIDRSPFVMTGPASGPPRTCFGIGAEGVGGLERTTRKWSERTIVHILRSVRPIIHRSGTRPATARSETARVGDMTSAKTLTGSIARSVAVGRTGDGRGPARPGPAQHLRRVRRAGGVAVCPACERDLRPVCSTDRDARCPTRYRSTCRRSRAEARMRGCCGSRLRLQGRRAARPAYRSSPALLRRVARSSRRSGRTGARRADAARRGPPSAAAETTRWATSWRRRRPGTQLAAGPAGPAAAAGGSRDQSALVARGRRGAPVRVPTRPAAAGPPSCRGRMRRPRRRRRHDRCDPRRGGSRVRRRGGLVVAATLSPPRRRGREHDRGPRPLVATGRGPPVPRRPG